MINIVEQLKSSLGAGCRVLRDGVVICSCWTRYKRGTTLNPIELIEDRIDLVGLHEQDQCAQGDAPTCMPDQPFANAHLLTLVLR